MLVNLFLASFNTPLPPGWLTLDKGKEENSWSDRKHLPRGKLSGLQFKTDQDWICQVRAR